ncbi:hypothetical protein B0J12DRAFT_582382 [Macrophomina phaseolina]|uniref:Rhodopsin domain-containing protein n=1 Tax=Macrophomina phaseolina TaxID=35725 RepID=A0ABQ8G0D3_9PEZI|nr:hypothetical protein B0J12DRAFT_582382 [Macrophomina phaseolina]
MVYTIQGVFTGIFQCTSVHRSWDKTVKGRCFDSPAYYYFAAVANIIADLAIIVLPISALSRLHLPKSREMGFIVLFALSGL